MMLGFALLTSTYPDRTIKELQRMNPPTTELYTMG